MNTYRTSILLVCLLLVIPVSALLAQAPPAADPPAAKKAPAAEKAAPATAKPAGETQVELTDKEIEKVAKLLAEYEKWDGKGKPAKSAAAWKKLVQLLDDIRKSKREPLAAVDSWSLVFCSDKYRRFAGRSGRLRNKKLQFANMGRAYEVVWHADVPGSYRAKTPIGLVLALTPTTGKFRGEEFLRQFWNEKELQTAIVVAPDFPNKFVTKEGASWSDRPMLWASMSVLGDFARDYNVAFDRFFLDGYGDGAVELWKCASYFADTYAGFIVRGTLPPDEIRLEDFRNNAFLLVGIPGAEMTPIKADALGARMKALGIDVTVANLSEAPRNRKEKVAFEPIVPALTTFLQKKRPRHPEQLDWSVKAGHTRRNFHVASVLEVEDEAIEKEEDRKVRPSFQVKADRKNNKLVITSHRILALKIWLNDVILDLNKDVTVEVNGKPLFNGRQKRSLKDLYKWVYNSGDWTRIFTCEVDIEIPQPEKKDEPKDGEAKKDEPKDGSENKVEKTDEKKG